MRTSCSGLPEGAQWLNLPEYVLSTLGWSAGCRVYECDAYGDGGAVSTAWCRKIFNAAHLDWRVRAQLVASGHGDRQARGRWRSCRRLRDTRLIAPACHDTASAIAAIPATGNDWAYISSGTWSLVGTLLEQPTNTARRAAAENFTNLGAVGGRVCFHKNVNGMWLMRQCWSSGSRMDERWPVPDLVAAAERLRCRWCLLDVDDPDLLLPGRMPQRINAQRVRKGFEALDERAGECTRICESDLS